MQQYLRLLNLRLDVVVKDVTGETGLAIIEAICKGESDAAHLASFRHYNCRKSKEEIAKALQSKNWIFTNHCGGRSRRVMGLLSGGSKSKLKVTVPKKS